MHWPTQEKSTKEVEKEQEAMLMAKYGGLKPKKKLLPKVHPASSILAVLKPALAWG